MAIHIFIVGVKRPVHISQGKSVAGRYFIKNERRRSNECKTIWSGTGFIAYALKLMIFYNNEPKKINALEEESDRTLIVVLIVGECILLRMYHK
jgi:hypothetical protein